MRHGIAAPRQAPPWRVVLRETVLIVAAGLAYFAVRGLIEGGPDRAFLNAERVIEFEQALHIYREHDIQGLFAGNDRLIDIANWIYIWGHWPVICTVALCMLLTSPALYLRYRNAFLISGALGIVIFAAFPLAPPRLMDLGLIDTVTERSYAYRVLQPPQLVNQFAAMPSLHFGWNLLIGIAIAAHAPWRPVRALGWLLPCAMFAAIVITANHYIIDGFAGGIVALTGFGLAAAGTAPYRAGLVRVRVLRAHAGRG
jgi:hypothetical protein